MIGPRRLLIVNADDFGLTERISAGIVRAHREGIVTSTSALALGPAFPKVAHWLADEGGLGVGVHLAAVGEDPPLLPATEIPTLVDRRGRLSESYKGLVAGRLDRACLEGVLARLAAHGAPSVEVTVHPGEDDDPDRRRYDCHYRGRDEVDALTSDAARSAVARRGFTLGTYEDLPAPVPSAG